MRKFTTLLLLLCLQQAAVRAQQVVVTATGGTLGPTNYTNFTTAFTAINNGTHTGSIQVSVTADFTETATPVLNASAGSASYTAILIKPAAGANPVITSSSDNTATIKLNGADNVTIDGSNNGTSSRNLTFQNSNTSGSGQACGIWLASNGTDGATNNVIKNCKIMGSNSSGAAYVGVGIYSSTTTMTGYWIATAATTGANSNNLIQNNLFNSANAAVVFKGGAGIGETGNQVTGNQIGDITSATNRKFTNTGIHMLNQANFLIDGNTITWFATVNSNVTPSGISIGTGCTNGIIRKNNLTNLRFASLSSAAGGIVLSSSASSNIKVYNNFLSDIASDGSATLANNAWGIAVTDGNGYELCYNSINMNTNPTVTATGYQAALYVAAAAGVNTLVARNNLFVYSGTNTTNKYSVYSVSPTPPGVTGISHNDYFSTGTLAWAGSAVNTQALVETSFQGGLANARSVQPVFVSATDLHLVATNSVNLSNLVGAGTAVAGITTDYDGTARPGTNTTMGAHELTACTPPVSPTAAGVARCGTGALTLNATGPAGATFNWYSAPTGGTLLGSGASFTTPSISTTTPYYVSTVSGGCESPRVTVNATVNPLPTVNLGPDTIMCAGSNYVLHALNPGASYLWDNSTTAQNRTVTQSGGYWVKVTNASSCSRYDTAQVTFIAAPAVNLGIDKEACAGDVVTLNAGSTGTTYLWDDGSTLQTRDVTTGGSYFVTVSNIAANCKGADTIQVTIHPNPVVNLGNDTVICHGNTLTLDAGNPGSAYLWDNGTTAATRAVDATGSYSVTVTDIHTCSASDAIFLQVKDLPSGTINAVHGDTATYTFYVLDARYVTDYTWDFGDGSTPLTGSIVQHRYERNGIFTVRVAFLGECGDNTGDTVTVDVYGARGTTGVHQINNPEGLNLYPNPARSQVTIDNKTGHDMQQLTVLNILGQVVYDARPTSLMKHVIPTAPFAPGIYTLRIKTSQGFMIRKFEVIR